MPDPMGLHWGGRFKGGPHRTLTQHQGLRLLLCNATALCAAHADSSTHFLLRFWQLVWAHVPRMPSASYGLSPRTGSSVTKLTPPAGLLGNSGISFHTGRTKWAFQLKCEHVPRAELCLQGPLPQQHPPQVSSPSLRAGLERLGGGPGAGLCALRRGPGPAPALPLWPWLAQEVEDRVPMYHHQLQTLGHTCTHRHTHKKRPQHST